MPFHQTNAVRYYSFESFLDAGITHAVFTRIGGVSPSPWDSLNVGGSVGDLAKRVRENRRRSFAALERPYESLYDVWQVHGNDVVYADTPHQPGVTPIKADAIITNRPEVTLFMRFADCVPILLYDPANHVAGMAHAGWQGTVKRIAANTVLAMQKRFGTNPADILAGIGPSIGPDHYQVGQEVAELVHKTFGNHALGLLPGIGVRGGNFKVKFDLWSANRLILNDVGVKQVENSNICTGCNLNDWYSHRLESGKTGRFGALIGL